MSPSKIHSALLLACGLSLASACTPELCVGDCDGETSSVAPSDELASLQACNVQSTIDTSRCGDGVAQAGELCFGPGTIIPLPGAPYTSVAGDFDGDGRTDVMWNDEAGHVTGLAGAAIDPLSTALAGVPLPSDVEWPALTGVGDFDGDGRLDVVGNAGNVTLLRGDGTGGFAPPQVIFDAPLAWGPTVLDEDGDGDLDLGIVAPSASIELIVLDNDGAGVFTQAPQLELSGADFPIVLADLDGVDPLDLIIGDEGLFGVQGDEGALHILARSPAGDTPSARPLAADYLHAIQAETHDVDADGRTDLVLMLLDAEHENSQGYLIYGSVAVFLSNGPTVGGSPSFDTGTYLPMDCNLHEMVMGDVDGDGVLDIVTSHYAEQDSGQSASIVVRRGDGLGGFEAVARVAAPVGVDKGGQVRLGDFDGDGRADITVLVRTDRQLVLYRGTD